MKSCLTLQSDFEIGLFQLKLDEKALAHSFGNRGCFTETVPLQPPVHSFGKGTILWQLAEKPSAWLLQDQAVPLELAGIRPAAI